MSTCFRARWSWVLMAFVLPLLAQKKEPLSLEAVASIKLPPRPGNPVFSPDGSRFVYTKSGELNLFLKADRSSKKVLDWKLLEKDAIPTLEPEAFAFENRRVRPKTVQWFPDNLRLLLVVKGDLFVADSQTGKVSQLTKTDSEEADPQLSPDGRKVAYRLNNELYTLEVENPTKIRQLTKDSTATRWNGRLDWVYPEELDLGTAFWWSPDSKKIAYLQFDVTNEFVYMHTDLNKPRNLQEPQRYPHAGTPNPDVRLGVLDLSKAKTKWVADAKGMSDLIWRVDWAPDSKLLAVQKSNRVQDKLDLWMIDADSGKSAVVLNETSKSWLNYHDMFSFLPQNQFLWASETSGFRHLEVYRHQGITGKAEKLRNLTAGDWLVTDVAGIDKSGTVFFSSTEISPLDRTLFRIQLDGSGKQRLTKMDGMFMTVMAPTADWYLELGGNAKTPNSAILRNAEGTEIQSWWQSDPSLYSRFDLPTTEHVNFTDAQGNKFYGRITKPADFDPNRKYPAVVSLYGGPHAQVVTNSWTGTPTWSHVLASKGVVIWEMDNRGSANRGLAWESALYRKLGKIELEDQLKGVDFLIQQGYVDAKRVGVTGWSYGGYMTLYSLLNASDRFAVGVSGAPVTNWNLYDTIYTERYLGSTEENKQGYTESSVLQQAANLKGKLLLIHCYQDDNVLFQNSMQLITALQKANKQFDVMLYPDKAHGVALDKQPHLRQKMIDYFVRELKAGE
jgi:dipeptidyl-peptidase 4